MLKHWIWLTNRPGIGVHGRAALLRLFGTAEQIYRMKESEYLAAEGFDRRWLEGLLDKSLDEAEKILTQCDNKEIRLLTYADPAYPNRLKNIVDPPALLYYRGTLPDIDGCYASKTGICQDLAALAACMLRVQGIPTRLMIGYAGKMYHAWNTVIINGEEVLYDPTLELSAIDSGLTYTVERYY